MNNQPIGVMDSGLGGLSVVVGLFNNKLPNESIVFVGDVKDISHTEPNLRLKCEGSLFLNW